MKVESSVITLEQYCKLESVQNQYLDSVANNEEKLIETFKDQFNFIKGQIVEVSFGDFGRIPAIVTKVNEVDENFHRSYDILLLIGTRILSTITSEKRYLWRFVDKQNEETINNYSKLIIDILDEEKEYGNYLENYELEEISYIFDDSIVIYKLPDYAKKSKLKIK